MDSLKQIIKKYFSNFAYFYKHLGYRVFVIIGLSIIVGFLDGLGLTMFLPLLEITDGADAASSDKLGNLGFIVTYLNDLGIHLTLLNSLLFLVFFFVLKGIFSYYSATYKVKVRQFFARTLRIKLLNLLSNYSYTRFVLSDVGRIQNTLTGELFKVTSSYASYFSMIQNSLMMLVYLWFAFMADWKFALLITFGGLLTNLFFRTIYGKTKKESALATTNSSLYQGLIIQFVSNFKYLKATGTGKSYVSKMRSAVLKIEESNKKIGDYNARVSAMREPILIIVVALTLLLQVYLFKGTISGVLISLLFFYRSLTALMSIQTDYNSFLSTYGALDNVIDFEKELKQNRETPGENKIDIFKDSIELRNIEFGYSKNTPIINNINLIIEKNKTIAFVGESGSGKTTIVNLICGLLDPNSGDIFIDNVKSTELNKASFQSRIGYITQEPVIFNDTIFNNVTFWDDSTPENIERFNHALEKASILDFVESLPEKENTLLGNNGVNLSGGQKQRISIARELYKDIDILILDEATSALDSETEKEIKTNLDRLKGEYTLIIIAHRLSTIKNADAIYLMDKGNIIGQGNFDELLTSSDRFRKMVELQEI